MCPAPQAAQSLSTRAARSTMSRSRQWEEQGMGPSGTRSSPAGARLRTLSSRTSLPRPPRQRPPRTRPPRCRRLAPDRSHLRASPSRSRSVWARRLRASAPSRSTLRPRPPTASSGTEGRPGRKQRAWRTSSDPTASGPFRASPLPRPLGARAAPMCAQASNRPLVHPLVREWLASDVASADKRGCVRLDMRDAFWQMDLSNTDVSIANRMSMSKGLLQVIWELQIEAFGRMLAM
mmetsp:Transcript_39315/g.130120  ORF Transcript_39315/g.130120 Transcript_39315/m.130120 type:complete len:235 (+) Transcript_39315:951-1655(+)